MSLTVDQILALAPDASSRNAGQGLAKPATWSGLGRAGAAIFGEVKGSGASPYRTVADPAKAASKCTCPSRKFPCKHALGLMLIDAATPLPEAPPPDWVSAWMAGRENRAAAAESRAREPDRPVDLKAQAKRRQARADRVAAALDELDLWLSDLMRRGLAAARAEPYAVFDRMAGRLVDGQVPGLARRVRALPGLAAAGPVPGAPKPEAALALAVGQIALLVRAARRLSLLDPEQAAGVRAALGLPVAADTLATRPGHDDDWAVLAHSVEEEDRLVARSVWLAGRRTGAVAQVIAYGPPGTPLPETPAAGQDFSGTLAFHPGDPALRAVLRDGRPVAAASVALPGGGTVEVARDVFAAVLTRAPWTERWPLRLCGVRLGRLADDSAFAVGDATGCLPLRASPHLPALLAVAAGHPVDLFGLYDGIGLAPLALVAHGRLYTVPPQEMRPILLQAA
ncbi:SWIM zinc finger family protein [Methylobacterium mesophilicum SR1.6/6]|uniref:SWIM zinc finger family protein n=1 Tax=Methylobacterium mesophilicum SR1.6/6 TaxID=908290 RepID=A0A6B9FIS3_9HYPH|nr:SWIM zinc finger family protein [Methylobacterium mesophilicum]QGY02443.1 SWIM zinc finger family protein [Methylobacterium mesophilicum SR1.6/6]